MPKTYDLTAFEFWLRVEQRNPDQCWLWSGSKTKDGYGQFGGRRRRVYAHRFSWELHNGPIPKGMNILHECDQTNCVNPNHLFLGTQADNVRDMIKKSRQAVGEQLPQSILSESDVKEIRRLHATNRFSLSRLGKMFNTVHTNIWHIVNRRSWSHVE